MNERPGPAPDPALPPDGPPARPPAATQERVPGRAAYIISQLYYYAAAVIGIGFVIGGAIGILLGLRTAILPEEYQSARDGFRTVLHSLAFGLPGLALVWWHLREARRREDSTPRPAFWGKSLYFHLVALIALGFVLGGAIAALNAAADAAVPQCYETDGVVTIEQGLGQDQAPSTQCYPDAGDAARSALDGALVLLAATPVWLWHLREGRRITAPD